MAYDEDELREAVAEMFGAEDHEPAQLVGGVWRNRCALPGRSGFTVIRREGPARARAMAVHVPPLAVHAPRSARTRGPAGRDAKSAYVPTLAGWHGEEWAVGGDGARAPSEVVAVCPFCRRVVESPDGSHACVPVPTGVPATKPNLRHHVRA